MRRGHGPKRSSPKQLVPVEIPQRKGDAIIFDHDEGYRSDASMETLGALRPIDGKRDPAAIVTAGNASQQNDAAAACLVVAEDRLEELGLTPDAVVRRLGGGGLRPFAHGHRPGSGGGAAVRTAWLQLGRYRLVDSTKPSRPQVASPCEGLGLVRGRFAPRHPQRQWLRHQPRPSHRRHRGPHPRRHGA